MVSYDFSVYRSFTSLVKFIPRYLILLNAVILGTAILISLSACSFNAGDLYIYIYMYVFSAFESLLYAILLLGKT